MTTQFTPYQNVRSKWYSLNNCYHKFVHSYSRITRMVCKVYGDKSMSNTYINEYRKCFEIIQTSLENDSNYPILPSPPLWSVWTEWNHFSTPHSILHSTLLFHFTLSFHFTLPFHSTLSVHSALLFYSTLPFHFTLQEEIEERTLLYHFILS